MANWYRTGTVAVTNGSANVVGTTTLWLTQASVGDIFVGPDGALYEITSITDDTHLAIKKLDGTAAYAGSTLSAQAYAIIRNFTSTLPATLASGLAALQAKYHVTLDEMVSWLSGTGSVTLHDAVGNAYTVLTPDAVEAKVTGELNKSVAGSSNVTLTSTEADNLLYTLTGTITASISLIVPTAPKVILVDTTGVTFGGYTLTVKTAAGTGVAITAGDRRLLTADGTNVVAVETFNRGTGVLQYPTTDLLGSAAFADLTTLVQTAAPFTITAATYTVTSADTWLIANYAGVCTLTLPTASLYPGRVLTVKTITANTVVSASSNVAPATSATAGTAILAGTAGKFATLVSDGINWIVMGSN